MKDLPLVLNSKKNVICFDLVDDDYRFVYIGKKKDYKKKVKENVDLIIKNNRAKSSCSLFSQYGTGDYRLPSVIIRSNIGSYSTNFKFKKVVKNDFGLFKELKGKIKDVISFIYEDNFLNAELSINFASFNDCDGFVSFNKLVNYGEKIEVNKLASFQYELFKEEIKVISFDGTWHNERNYHESILKGGRLEIDSFTGTSSSYHNPFVIYNIDKEKYISSNLIYSANHKTSVEIDGYKRTRIEVGVSDFLFSKTLNKGENYASPMCYFTCGSNFDEIMNNNHDFVLNHILEDKYKKAPRFILFNSWEGVYFDFDREKILNMAKKSKELGGELFVIDDGWFYKRDNEKSSLGDWEDYESKTGGINKLADDIRKIGLKFGIWMEPEMISSNSKLYKEHQDYVLKIPGKEPIFERWQLHLDLSKKEVQDYIYEKISKILKETKASYLKWDYNRNFTDIYKLNETRGYFDDYIEGFNSLLKRLRKEFSDVIFEGCASGGSRFDLGMLRYFSQIWTSDNNDALDRYKIETSTLLAYPSNVMCCHLCAMKNNDTKRIFSTEDRFNIALMGNLGYELNPLKLTKKEENDIKKLNQYYKDNRDFLNKAKCLMLGDTFNQNYGGVIFINKKKAIAILVTNEINATICLKGLKNDKIYYCKEDKKYYLGKDLLEKGIKLDASNTKYNFKTKRMTLIEKDNGGKING